MTLKHPVVAVVLVMPFSVSGCKKPRSKESSSRSSPADRSQPALTGRVVKLVARSFKEQAKLVSEVRGNTVKTKKITVSVDTTFEQGARQGKKYIAGVRFTLRVVGSYSGVLVSGMVGVGATRSEAVNAAIKDWGAYVLPALVGAVSPEAKKAHTVVANVASFYPGHTGFRGGVPGGWLDSSPRMHQKLLDQVGGSLLASLSEPLVGKSLHLLALMINVIPGRVGCQCRVDGRLSEALCTRLKALDWPGGEYLFKQYYVFKKAKSG